MRLQEYFDPHKMEHIRAYKALCRDGFWPQEFIDEMDAAGVEQEPCWQIGIAGKMADAWVDFMLERKERWDQIKIMTENAKKSL